MALHLARWTSLIIALLVLAINRSSHANPMYTVTALTSQAVSPPFAAGINDRGQVGGTYGTSFTTMDGFVYDSTSGHVTMLPVPPSTTQASPALPSSTWVYGFNNADQMVGVRWAPGAVSPTGFLYSGGQYTPLPGQPEAINNRGQVAGEADFVNGRLTNDRPPNSTDVNSHAYIFTNGVVKDLGTIGNSAGTFVSALNDVGQATGFAWGSRGPSAIFYDGHSLKDLGTLGDPGAEGLAINNHGDVVGSAGTSNLWGHAFLSPQGGKMIDLGVLPGGDNNSVARGINDKGQIVGNSSNDSSGYHRAFLYQNGVMTDLNALIPLDSRVLLTDAFRINNAGQIVAVGIANGERLERLYLLTPDGQPQPVPPNPLIAPVPEPSTLAFYSVSLVVAAAGTVVRRRRDRKS